jgi:hypothetical protein
MLVARLLATAALWVRLQTYLKKCKMGDISKVATQARKKKKKKKIYIYSIIERRIFLVIK